MENRYSGTTPIGRKVVGRLEVEEGVSYIATPDGKGGEHWYMVKSASVRKEVA